MPRRTTAAFDAAVAAGDVLRLAIMVRISHPDGDVLVWNGLEPLEHDGDTYTGVGMLGGISGVKSSQGLEIYDIRFILSGVPPEAQSLLEASLKGRIGTVRQAIVNQAARLVSDPLPLVTAELDYQVLRVEDDGSATIAVVARAGLVFLERSIDLSWTAEQQRSEYPDDSGLDGITEVPGDVVTWTPT